MHCTGVKLDTQLSLGRTASRIGEIMNAFARMDVVANDRPSTKLSVSKATCQIFFYPSRAGAVASYNTGLLPRSAMQPGM